MQVSRVVNSTLLSKSDDAQLATTHQYRYSKECRRTKIETFQLSPTVNSDVSASTTKILSNYTREPPPNIPDEVLEERRLRLQEHAETVEQLREWAKHGECSMAGKVLRHIFLRGVKSRMPSEEKLFRSIDHFFPPRSDIRVTICDFGDGRAARQHVRLGDIERGMLAANGRRDTLSVHDSITCYRIPDKAPLVYSSMDVRGNPTVCV